MNSPNSWKNWGWKNAADWLYEPSSLSSKLDNERKEN